MVSKEARWILGNTTVDPKLVADVWGIDENECWEYLTDLHRVLRDAESIRDEVAIHQEARDWSRTIPDWNNIRIEAIKSQLIDAKTHPEKHDVPKLLLEVKILRGTAERPTPEMIARAKEYPIAQMLTVTRRGNISCPFHKDTNPSFQIRTNNTFKCYSCGEYGDSIALYRKLHNTTFIEAVRSLQ